MNKTALATAFAAFLCAGALPAQTPNTSTPNIVEGAAHAITPEDILSIRELDELRLSPDGKRIAFLVREPADPKLPRQPRSSNIWIVPADGSERPRPIVPDLKNAASPLWSSDGRTLAFLSNRGVEVNSSAGQPDQVHLLHIDGGDRGDGGQVERLTTAPGGVEQFVWSPDGKTIAFVARDQATVEEQERAAAGYDAIEVDRNFKYNRLWVTNLSDRKAVQVTKQDFEINELAWSPKGDELALVVARTPKPEDSFLLSLVVVNRLSGNVARTLSTNVAPISGLLRWSPDGRSITLLEGTKEFASWVSLVASDGGSAAGVVRPLMKDYRGTIYALDWTSDSKHLLAQSVEGTRQALMTIDSTTGAVRRLASVMQSQWDWSFSTSGQTIAYLAQTPDSPSDIWVLTKDGQPRQITNFNPQTKSWRLGKVREVEWKNSKDGLTRRGVLITPPGYQPGNLYPTVVNTHPGNTPWWAGWHAKWWAWGQLLASNGYVVFLPNTRGVTGEGWRLHATTMDWGGMAFQDLMDGVDYLVDQRIADPNRLGIGGWSNGGFMTEYAITRTTRFKAAVAQAGHADFFSLHGTSPYMHVSHHVSTPDSPYHNRKWYDDHSPITLIRNCRTPTLLIHGINDGGVPVGQAYEFYTGLRDVGVETELVIYPREGHNIQEYPHQVDLQKRVLAWFDKHLRPVGQASAQSADAIIARYLKARGGYEKLKAIKTLRMTGTYQEGESIFGTYIEWKRPSFRVVVVGVPNEVYREGFNGTSWEFSSPSGQLKITEASSAAGKAARRGAEFDESIIDYREKGHRVELIGQEKLNSRDVYLLRVTLSDGWVKDYYLDTETYLIVAIRKAMPLHATGPDIESLSMYEDYRPVAGVLFPHSFVERNTATDKIMNTLRWKLIEPNIKIDDGQFNPPLIKKPAS